MLIAACHHTQNKIHVYSEAQEAQQEYEQQYADPDEQCLATCSRASASALGLMGMLARLLFIVVAMMALVGLNSAVVAWGSRRRIRVSGWISVGNEGSVCGSGLLFR